MLHNLSARLGRRPTINYCWLLAASILAAILIIAPAAQANTAVSGAVYTTVNPEVDGSGHCLNGAPGADAGLVNCNTYDGKDYVWLSGGPEGRTSALADGKYFFAVLSPGGQGDANDGAEENLSDRSSAGGDDWTNRVFTVKDGVISYEGGHKFDKTTDGPSRYGKIALANYDDTTNPGGEYILAVCNLADAGADGNPGVNPSDCKYDAFKVRKADDPPAKDLTIEKTANPTYDKTYRWEINKDVDKTLVQQIGGNATFAYTVKASHDDGQDGNWQLNGQIIVANPNGFDVSEVDVSDTIDNNGNCVVDGGGKVTVPGNDKIALDYLCKYETTPDPSSGKNTATATWFEGGDKHVSAEAAYDFAGATVNEIDECATISDSYAGSLGNSCVGDSNPQLFTYSRTVTVPTNDCLAYDNTATLLANDSGAQGSADKKVQVCGPAKTGALTIGFWKTTNGQNLIKTYCLNGSNSLAAYLRGLAGGGGPFADAPTSSKCSDLASYVGSVLSGASASDMNKMVRAQMLGSALDVWFSGPGFTATTVNKIKPPAIFLTNNSLGGFKMDARAVCPMVDNTSTGTATCKDNKPSTDAVAAGAVNKSPMTVQEILDLAASRPPFNGLTSAPVWYGGDRSKEEVLKNIYDQLNNQLAFGSF